MEKKQNATDVTAIGHSETLTTNTPHRDVLQKCAHLRN